MHLYGKESNPLLSIIVPVYNTEQYLPRCINSILSQTYTNFELILVDDGSTDSSGQICDEFQRKDPRVKSIHQRNQGVSSARGVGLEASEGEYIGFVDSDDYVAPNMYTELMYIAMSNDADIACCGHHYIHEDEDLKSELSPSETLYISYTPQETFLEMVEPKEGKGQDVRITILLWDKLYRRELFVQSEYWKYMEEFPYCYLEDGFILMLLVSNAEKTISTNEKLYIQTCREGSLSKERLTPYKLDFLNIGRWRVQFFLSLGLYRVYQHFLRGHGNNLIKYWSHARQFRPDDDTDQLARDFKAEYNRIFWELMTQSRSNLIFKLSFVLFRICPEFWFWISRLALQIRNKKRK